MYIFCEKVAQNGNRYVKSYIFAYVKKKQYLCSEINNELIWK